MSVVPNQKLRDEGSAKTKPFYGWVVTGMGSFCNALQGGVVFWSMGIYTSTFEDHFGASRARVTLIETFVSVGANFFSPIIGYLVDKWSARAIISIGTASLGAGLIVCSMAVTLMTVWFAFLLLIPLGVISIGTLPTSTVISRWFRKRRGLALGISVAGSSVGGALVPPLMTWMFIAYGWRTAMFSTGVFIICLAPLFYYLIANRPEDKGLKQEEEGAHAGAELTAADQVDWRVKDLLRTGQFWLQTFISGSMLAVTLGVLANLSLYTKDLGLTLQQSAPLYSIIAFCSFAGKILFGALIDRLGLRTSGMITAAFMVIGLFALSVSSVWIMLAVACVPIGLAVGGVSPLWTNMISRGFGAKSFGRAMGIMNPFHMPITAPAAPLAGYISDTTGSYQLVFAIYIGLMVAAGFAVSRLKAPQAPDRSV